MNRVCTEIDRHVAAKVREARQLAALNQAKLAAAIGVTTQQMGKYESGANRISSARLHRIATALSVSVDSFFAGLGEPLVVTPRQRALQALLRHCIAMPAEHRRAVLELARSLAEHEVTEPRAPMVAAL